ncbi:hypothetical protein QTI33_32055 [Variovorax sp. J22P271]|uniref:hypothetical protein n=1 Tax=Variovorax davisae TaxID=3053515 RepID=UPI002577C25E|nr:hypothetical protein [Variovorax sp. J22P271]MDM0036807.1 hypothetical protein [Variovorax sp. J22P271]
MSEATTRITNTLLTAAVPSAPPEAHQRAAGGRGAGNLSKLPVLCYALVPSNEPGRRIALIKAGERGYYVTDFDGQAMELAEARILVDRLNVRMGVTDAQHQAMVAGAAFGFHVPAADPDHPSNGGTLRTVDASMVNADEGCAA